MLIPDFIFNLAWSKSEHQGIDIFNANNTSFDECIYWLHIQDECTGYFWRLFHSVVKLLTKE